MAGIDDAVYNFVTAIPTHRRKLAVIAALALSSIYVANKKQLLRHPLRASIPANHNERRRVSRKVASAAILQPGVASKESALLIFLALTLIARTGLDIWFSAFNGVVVRSIVSRDWPLFVKNAVVLFGVMMWPMSAVNNFLKLTINRLSLSFRTRLTHYAHEQYLKGITFYKVANLDNRIQNADQLLTQDIDKFSETLSHLYSDIAKPLVDIGLFAYKLGESIGLEAPLLMLAYFASSGFLLRVLSPPFGKYIAIEQNLEGEFRYNHSRIIAHSEEIAFYSGAEKERAVANATFQKIVDHTNRVFLLRFANGIVDSVLVKYCATQLAFFILSRPVFGSKFEARYAQQQQSSVDSTRIMEDYSRNSGFLINLSQAVGRIVLAGRDLTRFAGYTSRVSELLDVLDDINAGRYALPFAEPARYQRTMVGGEANHVKTIDQAALSGRVVEQDGIIDFREVPIATPNGDVLVERMSFQVRPGMNCLITGPNGCGKSSLFRILGNLWPVFGGEVIKPAKDNMFYVPQKPYLPLGTLRDQIIYPHSLDQARSKGYDDGCLLELLEQVRLAYLVQREGGWDAVRDWADVLSGGEKQRVAMARLFYHRPQFAILDECTSAVSIDVEGVMYRYAGKLGITLFTVSHRPSLFPYHDYLLRFDGQGGYEFMELKHDSSDPQPLSPQTNGRHRHRQHPFAFADPARGRQQPAQEASTALARAARNRRSSRDLFYAPDPLSWHQTVETLGRRNEDDEDAEILASSTEGSVGTHASSSLSGDEASSDNEPERASK